MIFNFENIDESLIETLSKFHKNNININELHEEAQDFYFLEGFSDALALELSDPSDDFIKAIFNRMEGKRMTDQIKAKLKNLINSNSIQNSLPFVIESESKNGNIVITTAEELKIYHSIKTTLLGAMKKIDPSRINYRDQKNSFNVIIDDNNKKIIAKITSSKNKYFIDINGCRYDFNGIESVVALKKPLVDLAQQYFNEQK